MSEGLVDVVEDVDWSTTVVPRTMLKWFGRDSTNEVFKWHPYLSVHLHAIERSDSRYVLHLDDDMLLHLADGARWIRDGLALMQRNAAVAVVTPEGGPPMSVWGGPLLRKQMGPSKPIAHEAAGDVTTRVFLMDRDGVLPHALPLRAGEPAPPWRSHLRRPSCTEVLTWDSR